MRVDGYNQTHNSPIRDGKAGKAEQAAAAGAVSPESAEAAEEGAASTDSVEISADAQQLLSATSGGDVDPEKVARARKILESGTYNDRGVIEKTAERIADRFSAEG